MFSCTPATCRLFSRLGSYDCALLDEVALAKSKRFFEYWGHEASLLPIDYQSLLRWRVAPALRGKDVWRELDHCAVLVFPVKSEIHKAR